MTQFSPLDRPSSKYMYICVHSVQIDICLRLSISATHRLEKIPQRTEGLQGEATVTIYYNDGAENHKIITPKSLD